MNSCIESVECLLEFGVEYGNFHRHSVFISKIEERFSEGMPDVTDELSASFFQPPIATSLAVHYMTEKGILSEMQGIRGTNAG